MTIPERIPATSLFHPFTHQSRRIDTVAFPWLQPASGNLPDWHAEDDETRPCTSFFPPGRPAALLALHCDDPDIWQYKGWLMVITTPYQIIKLVNNLLM